MIDYSTKNPVILSDSNPSNTPATLSKKAYDYHCKGNASFLSSRFGQAKDFYEKSVEAYEKAGDAQGKALSLTHLGRAHEMLGDYPRAGGAYQEGLKIFETLSELPGIARGKAQLGSLGWATGNYSEAAKLLDEANALYRIGGDIAGEAWVYDLMGNLQLAMRNDTEAEQLYRWAFYLVSKLGLNLENTAWDNYHFGAVALFRGQLTEAKDRFLEALKLFKRLKDDLGQVAALTHLGEIASSQKDYTEAKQNFLGALKLVVPTKCMPLLADTMMGLAELLKRQGEERKSISILMVALSHPTCRQQTKDRMVALAMELESSLSPEEVEKGFGWAKDFGLEDMASSWVSSVFSKTKNNPK